MRLHPSQGSETEARQARALLTANVRHLLAHAVPCDAKASSHSRDANASSHGSTDGRANVERETEAVATSSTTLSMDGPDDFEVGGVDVFDGVAMVRDGLQKLLSARSLAWELHAEQLPLWNERKPLRLATESGIAIGENGEEFLLIDMPNATEISRLSMTPQ